MTSAGTERVEVGLGWSLGVLLRAYDEATRRIVDGLPHLHRGYQVLAAVDSGRHPSQLALAAELGIDRTVMTYVIDDLVSAGLVERRPNPDDRRQRLVVATKAGQKQLGRCRAELETAEELLLSSLPVADRARLRATLASLADHLADRGSREDLCSVVERALR